MLIRVLEFSGADVLQIVHWITRGCVCVCLAKSDFEVTCSAVLAVVIVVLETVLICISDLTLLSYVISFHFDTFYQTLMEMTQANKLSLNFPSLCPLVSSFINWTANVVLIFSFLQLNLGNDPDCLLFMAQSCFSLTFPSAA